MKKLLFIIAPLIIIHSACIGENIDPTQSESLTVASSVAPDRTPSLIDKKYPTLTQMSTSIPFTILPIPSEWPYPNPISVMFPMSSKRVSPNNTWVYYGAVSIYIAHISGAVVWELPISLAEELSGGCCRFYSNLQWSQDGRYLYFSTLPYIDPGCPFCDGLGYWQLDIITGEIIELLPASIFAENMLVYAISISNDEKSLAYISIWEKPLIMHVLNLETREKISFPIDEKHELAGNIKWGPNDLRLVYVGASNGDLRTYLNENTLSIILLDISNGSQHILLETDDITFLPSNWNDPNLIEFDIGCEILYFDITRNSLTLRATQTPDPDPRFDDWCEAGLINCCP